MVFKKAITLFLVLAIMLPGLFLGVTATSIEKEIPEDEQRAVTFSFDGVYTIKSKQADYYAQIDNDDASNSYGSDNAILEVWAYTGEAHQCWRIISVSNGYYKILSLKSGKAITVQSNYENSNNKALVQSNFNEGNDRQLWKITQSSNGGFIIRPKSGEAYSTDWCMAAKNSWPMPWNGRNVIQGDYVSNTSYFDEWIISPVIFNLTVNSYYDNGYSVRYGETNSQSVAKIEGYMSAISNRYNELLNLTVYTNSPTYYSSPIDICKGTVTSSNINTLCSHSGTIHTDRSEVISDFKNHYIGNNITTNLLWSNHKIKSVATNGTVNYNRSVSSGYCIFVINNFSTSSRPIDSKSVTMHELNHQMSAPDHYHELADLSDPASCKFKSICSVCGVNPRPSSCVMNNPYGLDISSSDVICDGCKCDMLLHLVNHHK